jgi:molecular chaperone DnaK (HSP70)
MSSSPPPSTKRFHVFGIDFGSQRCVVADHNGDIVLNELGGMTTATLVSFNGEERNIGEAAVLSSSTNPLNTIDYLNVFIGKKLEEVKQKMQFFPGQRAICMENDKQQVVIQVDYLNSKHLFTMEQLTAMLFGQLLMNIKKRLVEKEEMYLVIAVPTGWKEKEKKALTKALKIAKIDFFHIISRDQGTVVYSRWMYQCVNV